MGEKTKKNLAGAFAGESQARTRYMAWAVQAELEGHTELARTFREIAEQEFLHAQQHLRCMGMVKSSLENVEAAIKGETREFTEMYPQMIAEAEEEGDQEAVQSFTQAMNAEKIHATRYRKLLMHLKSCLEKHKE